MRDLLRAAVFPKLSMTPPMPSELAPGRSLYTEKREMCWPGRWCYYRLAGYRVQYATASDYGTKGVLMPRICMQHNVLHYSVKVALMHAPMLHVTPDSNVSLYTCREQHSRFTGLRERTYIRDMDTPGNENTVLARSANGKASGFCPWTAT
jgi:hypothetical protein